MLKPDVAKERLKAWRLSEDDTDDPAWFRYSPILKKLPKQACAAGYALFGRDADGSEFEHDDWEERHNMAAAARERVDELGARQRAKLFGALFPNIAEQVDAAWELLKRAPYSGGYVRKAFRTPAFPGAPLEARCDWASSLFGLTSRYQADIVTCPWLAAWAPFLDEYYGREQDTIGRLLAGAIDAGGPVADEVFEILTASACNEHEIGGMGAHVIRGLLSASRPEGWELIEKTLLAAQRQEGLRQAVLETIDEAHPQAFRRMLRLIIDHKLARFSAVTRAVDVWFGLAWDSATVKTVNDTIASAAEMLDDPAACHAALKGDDAEQVFMALWVMAFDDAVESAVAALELLDHPSVEHRFAAAHHFAKMQAPFVSPDFAKALDDEDLRVAYSALPAVHDPGPGATDEDVFDKLERLYERTPAKAHKPKPLIWPWVTVTIDRKQVALKMYYMLGDRPATRILPYIKAFDGWMRRQIVEALAEQKKWDKLTHDALVSLAGDTSPDARQAAITALAKKPLRDEDLPRLEAMLTRKASDLRRGVIGLLLVQDDDGALASADRLLESGKAPQRLAGLEMLRQLAEDDRARDACRQRAAAYADSRKKLTNDETTQLDAINNVGAEKLTLENGLGLFDLADRTPVVPPKKRKVKFITDAAVACLKSLDDLVHEHREEVVTIVNYEGNNERHLLGNLGWSFPSPEWHKAPSASDRECPLQQVWEKWRDKRKRKLKDGDGFEIVRAHILTRISNWEWRTWQDLAKRPGYADYLRAVSGGHEPPDLRYECEVKEIVEWLVYWEQPNAAVDWLLDAVETAYAILPANAVEDLARPDAPSGRYENEVEGDQPYDWRNGGPISEWFGELFMISGLVECGMTPEQQVRCWQLGHWADEPIRGAKRDRPGLNVLLDAYAADGANLTDVYDHVLGPRGLAGYNDGFDELRMLTRVNLTREYGGYLEQCPQLHEVVNRCRDRVLEVELARGEEATAATQAAHSLQAVRGVDNLLRVLTALGKERYKTSASYYSDAHYGRVATLTHLAEVSYAGQDDTPESFAHDVGAAVKAGHIDEQRVLELAFLAPQWSRHVEAYFKWDGFCEGVYWLLAHMNYIYDAGERAAIGAGVGDDDSAGDEQDTQQQRSGWDRLIMERTPLTDEDRRGGAVDIDWFQRVYKRLTKKRWEAMSSAARFAATAAQAKRAQLVADVLLGRVSRKFLIDGIKQRNLKEYVRLLGLLPLAKGTRRDSDIATRYKVLLEYRRYANKLSAMSKEDAVRSAEVGMQNLARTVGYPDPLRLEWAMEAEAVKDLADGPVAVERDGYTVTLALDEASRPSLTVTRGEKTLKTLPAKIKKKDKKIAALADRVKELKRQASRMRQSLETAMCRGDLFTAPELVDISAHAVLAPLVSRLVFIGEGIMGYPDKGGKVLRDHAGKLEPIKKNEALRIAHAYDLFETGRWDKWQHECFAAERLQPFKQVFRELYVLTKQERSDGNKTRRYAGQQVNPMQANALWGQRGWGTQDGVWKTFYDVGVTASVEFDYGVTTPLEVEGLTIECVRFFKRDERHALQFADVPPRIFSEIMRDMDLVVSVAHRGGVDPEASASTVEMRATLLRETCQLLGIDNVRLKEPHAMVDGDLGQYSVHLGSAGIHKMPGGALCVVPVHAQHRGRLFLPFADDDPRTAEVISKVLMLARDQDIQDPVILDQLRR